MAGRLPDYMMDSAIFIYPSIESADVGEEKGATGFLIGIPSKVVPHLGHIYAVTNSHVIEHGGRVVRMNKKDRRTATFDLSDAWVSHPDGDDLAIAPLQAVTDPTLSSRIFHADILITKDQFEENSVGIGDDVYMVGRFLGHEHRKTNSPVIQQGKIASPITHLTNPETSHEQLSILVELRSMGGYSGSVVILDPPGKVLGINYCHLPVKSFVKFEDEGIETDTEYFVKIPSGMAAVVPAWKLTEMLDMDQFKKQRAEDDIHLLKNQEPKRTKPSLDYSDPMQKEQKTHAPKKEDRIDIPVPTRRQFERDLSKAIKRKPK